MSLKPHLWSITCLTNLHVGSSGTSFGIIDKEVERDPITNVPVIHASGLKGALREHCEGDKGLSEEAINYIFGAKPNDDTQGDKKADNQQNTDAVEEKIEAKNSSNKKSFKQGQFKFLEATCLLRPLRVSSGSNRSYILATTKDVSAGLQTLAEGLGYQLDLDIKPKDGVHGIIKVEGETEGHRQMACKGIENILDDSKEPFIDVARLDEYALPVVARNQLEDGISNNLWYEEFVPHKSIFYFFLLAPDDAEYEEDYYKDFKTLIESTVIQIGGNSTVGYGYCRLREVEEEQLDESVRKTEE